jgi:hypothetical protein
MVVCLALMCAAAGATLLAARGQRITVDGGEVSGAETPTAAALASVTFAAVGALLLLADKGRRVVGVLLVVVGAATTAVMLSSPDGAAWFAYGPIGQGEPRSAVRSPSAWVGAAAGITLMLAAAWLVFRVPQWPVRARSGVRPEPPPGSTNVPTLASDWDRIDRGEDPTV